MRRITLDEAKQYRKLDPHTSFKYSMREAIAFTVESDSQAPEWDIVTYYGASWIDPTNIPQHPHYIYILVNPSIPGVCKIGYTTTTVYDRVRQINAATGVIAPWYPIFSYKCPNGKMLEREIHEHLQLLGVRISPNREGFCINTDSARTIIESIGKKYDLGELNA